MNGMINAIKDVIKALTKIARKKQIPSGELEGVTREEIDLQIEILDSIVKKSKKKKGGKA